VARLRRNAEHVSFAVSGGHMMISRAMEDKNNASICRRKNKYEAYESQRLNFVDAETRM
jgi:hypothetical protein